MRGPLNVGTPGSYHCFDWHADRFDAEPVPVRPAPVLVVEGCGSAPRRLDPWTTLRGWVEAPAGRPPRRRHGTAGGVGGGVVLLDRPPQRWPGCCS